jgi:hypothetical protein
MGEKLPVLTHHEVAIRKWYPGIVDLEEAKQKARKISLKNALRSKNGGSPGYPRLKFGDTETREKYVESIAREVVAVNTGDYVIIPDLDLGGEKGDLWCHSCGNLDLGEDGKYKCKG